MTRTSTSTTFQAVITTVDNADLARQMAKALVEQQLAACAQISAIESFYRWQGTLEHSQEWRILFKTRTDLYPQVLAAIQALHSYDLPAIHAIALDAVEPAYGEWIKANTAS